jgi:hypothetical protein
VDGELLFVLMIVENIPMAKGLFETLEAQGHPGAKYSLALLLLDSDNRSKVRA